MKWSVGLGLLGSISALVIGVLRFLIVPHQVLCWLPTMGIALIGIWGAILTRRDRDAGALLISAGAFGFVLFATPLLCNLLMILGGIIAMRFDK